MNLEGTVKIRINNNHSAGTVIDHIEVIRKGIAYSEFI
ncbi:hypothetical protein D1AOALGA4SA_5502 [Olavius algarvensis Delta 1 endosymbiont]|nr:hypothetical protein D1AOALGA4SA_5502 [Olavius algarvensis Delta 1 endosymbiont]